MALNDTHTLASVGRRAPPWSILSSLECREGLQGSWPLCCLGTGCSSNEPIQCLGSVQKNQVHIFMFFVQKKSTPHQWISHHFKKQLLTNDETFEIYLSFALSLKYRH